MTRAAWLVLALLVSTGHARADSSFVIVNTNSPGQGFNDTTPAVPVGGNTGTTRGEQRLIAFQYAADLWGGILDSVVPIRVSAGFASLTCDMDGGAPRKRLFTSTTYLFLALMAGSSMILFAVAMLFMRNQIRPIRRLAMAADALGKGLDVEVFRIQGATEVRTHSRRT